MQHGRLLSPADGGYFHWCPACVDLHFIAVDRPLPNGAQWEFSGNLESPTFKPSVDIKWPRPDGKGNQRRCHYFIREGRIEYCKNCSHDHAGKIVVLPPIPEDEV